MTKSIPAIDSLGWGEALNDHLGQLIDPAKGGFNTVADIAERDSKFWGNGASDKDAFANKTVYVTSTGTFHVWTVSGNFRQWQEIQKAITSQGWLSGAGTVQGFGYELRGSGVNFSTLQKYSQIKVPVNPSVTTYLPLNFTEIILNVEEVISSSVVRVTEFPLYEIVRGGYDYGGWLHPDWAPYNTIKIESATNARLTFNQPVSNFGPKPGDQISQLFGVQGIVTAVSGNIIDITPIAGSPGSDPRWQLDRSILPGSAYSYNEVMQSWSDGSENVAILNSSGGFILKDDIQIEKNLHTSNLTSKGFNFSNTFNEGLLLDISERDEVSFEVKRGSSLIYSNKGIYFFTGKQNGTPSLFTVCSSANHDFTVYNRKVGINIVSPAEALHVVGNILATGTVSQSSDERLKKDIKVVDGALAKISQIKGVTYKWKKPENHGDDEGRQLGVIAQDVEKVFPEAVKEDKEGIKSVNYGDMVAPLIEAVKELKLIIDQQQNEIEELRSVISHHA